MTHLARISSIAVLLVTVLGAPACSRSHGTGGTESTPVLARRLVRDEGALLLDVRSFEEFESGHVEGAKLIPHDQVAARLDEIAGLLGLNQAQNLENVAISSSYEPQGERLG